MANFVGIPGYNWGDGTGGNVALSIQERVMRIIRDESIFVFMSLRSPIPGDDVRAGTVYIRQPMIPQSRPYSVSQVVNEVPQVDSVKIDIDSRRTNFYEIESFDTSRIIDADAVLGEIAGGLSSAIMADMSAHYFLMLADYFENDTIGNSRVIVSSTFGEPTATEAQAKADSFLLGTTRVNLEKTYSRKYIGVPGSEILSVIDGYGVLNMVKGTTTGNSGDMALGLIQAGGFAVRELWGTRYVQCNLIGLGADVATGQSWALDYAYDMSNYRAFIIHTEAFAFVINNMQIESVRNQNNLNIRYIAKYQFGGGRVRDLAYAIVHAPLTTELKKARKTNSPLFIKNMTYKQPLSSQK